MSKSDKIKYLIAALIFVSIVSFSFLRDNYRERSLEKTISTHAFYYKYSGKTVRDDNWCYFSYTVEKKKFSFKESGSFPNLKIGDSVEIEYSISDHSVARVKSIRNK